MKGPEPDPPTDGRVVLDARVLDFAGGPAPGAQKVTFTVTEVDILHQEIVAGVPQPPVLTPVAYGPAPLAFFAPEYDGAIFAGEYWLAPGLVREVRVSVSSMSVVDGAGQPHQVVFGAQNNPSGILRFQLPPNTPAPELPPYGRIGFELRVPAGPSGALHPISGGRFRLDPALPGAARPQPVSVPYSTHSLLVKWASDATPAEVQTFLGQTGASVYYTSVTGLQAVSFENTDWWSVVDKLRDFRDAPEVGFTSLDPVSVRTHHDTTSYSDYSYDAQHWLQDARIAPTEDHSTTAAWDATTGSREVIVAFIDQGLDWDHPDLANNLYVNVGEFPDDLLDTCGLDPDLEGWTLTEALDFDADGVFTLHDLNAELDDDTFRNDQLARLDTCGLVLDPFVVERGDVDGFYSGSDLVATFADGLDNDGNGFVDDLIGANLNGYLMDDGSGLTYGEDQGFDARMCVQGDAYPDDLIDVYGSSYSSYDAIDGIQHGTQMAGVLGAEGDNGRNIAGVMHEVRILEVRNGGPYDGIDVGLPFSMQLAGFDYAIAQGASVIVVESALVEAGSYDLDDPDAQLWYDEAIAKMTNEFLARSEALFVVAAGNGTGWDATTGLDCDDDDVVCWNAEAHASNVISVMATAVVDDAEEGDLGSMSGRASYSNYGDESIDIAAPGGVLPSISIGFPSDPPTYWGDYAAAVNEANGTSAAIAVVAGVAGLRIAACGPSPSAADLRTTILEAAQDRSTTLTCADGSGTGPCSIDGNFIDAGAAVVGCP